MDLPTYFDIDDKETQGYYQQDLNQTLRANLSNNGWVIPSITHDELAVDVVVDASTGIAGTLASAMPDGTIWHVTDATPPCYVGKIQGTLVKFATAVYP